MLLSGGNHKRALPLKLRYAEDYNRGYASPRPLEVIGFDGERGVNRDEQLYTNGVFD